MKPPINPPSPANVRLFDLSISSLTRRQTIAWLDQQVLAPDGAPACVFSANVDQVLRYHADPSFRDAFAAASLVIPDGMPIVWSGQWLGRSLPERVTGIDLLEDLCELAARRSLRCYLLGAEPAVVGAAALNLQRRFPALEICGCHHGYFADDEPVVEAIQASRADLLFVGMGSPRQESWLRRNFSRLPCRLALPVGGAFEVIAGVRRRAPRLLQGLGLEWGWRLCQEPRRLWRRYLIEDLRFLNLLLRERKFHRACAPPSPR